MLAEPDGTVRAGIDIPDPAYLCPTRSGCRAVVRTGNGATFVVDGATGTTLELDLGNRADNLDYWDRSGGGRWGYFGPPDAPLVVARSKDRKKILEQRKEWPHAHRRSALVDFATGAVTDLRDVHSAQFSPDGETLAVEVRSEHGEARGLWLIPTRDPSRSRPLAIGDGIDELVDFDGDRLLYRERIGDRERIVVMSVTDRIPMVIVQTPPPRNALSPFESWLLPGRREAAVLAPEGFTLVDPSDGTPRELLSVPGNFVTAYLHPSGKGAVLYSLDPFPGNTDRSPRFIDLERGTSRLLEGETGEPVDILEWGTADRWFVVSSGEDGYKSSSFALLDVETGTMSRLSAGNTWSRVSDDGRSIIFDLPYGRGANRCTVVDLSYGTTTALNDRPDRVALSPDRGRAAYSMRVTVGGVQQWILKVAETVTGKPIFSGPGKDPVWLAP